ncbi:thiamine pyrophosphate-binding protein [bacterium]|nr:thiamine pyrophosphate-binding protein [bacterium]
MTTIHDEFAEALYELGVRYVFGIPGGSWIDYMDAMRRVGVEFVLVSNEASAGFMAAVTGRLTGKPGVCYGTLGPGATNLCTGVGCAYLDRNPLIALTHEVLSTFNNRRTQMGIDHQALFKPITKWTTRLRKSRIKETFTKAFEIANSEVPGPVHIGIPSNFEEDDNSTNDSLSLHSSMVPFPDPERIEKMVELFEESQKPILAIGLSSVRSEIQDLLLKIIDKHQLPVVLTPMAKGLVSEDHPMYAGVLFHVLQNYVAKTYKEADLVISIGYDPVEYNYEDWLPDVPLIHIDSNPSELPRNKYKNVLDIVGEIKPYLDILLSLEKKNNEWNKSHIVDRKRDMFNKFQPKDNFGPLSVLLFLRDILADDGIITCDVGAHTHLIGQMWRTPSSESLIMTNGWSSMGFGIPAAIAAKLVYPDRKVVCITGDGGFLMMVGEMATAKRLGVHIVFIVLMDKELTLIRLKQNRKGFPPYGTSLFGNDYKSPDSYFGVPVIEAKDNKSYHDALKKAFSHDGPIIIEAFIEGSEYDELVLK